MILTGEGLEAMLSGTRSSNLVKEMVNKNLLQVIMQYNNRTIVDEIQLEGLVIQASPTDRVYLPKEALLLLAQAGHWLF